MATNKHDRIEKLLDVLGSGLYEKEKLSIVVD